MRQAQLGAASAAGAYILWGLMPLYFKAIQSVPPLEIVAHRIVWSALLLLIALGAARRLERVRSAIARPGMLRTLLASAALVSSNWLIFVWAVNNDRILDASLGYYINPLITIALGALFLGERMTRLQLLAVLFALAGVANELWAIGHLPWISLSLAITFGLYGLLRKRAPVDAASGLMIETACLTPLAAAWLLWQASTGQLTFGASAEAPGMGMGQSLLLMASGVVTTLPLLLFAFGAQRLTLASLGFLQYLAPSINLVLAISIYRETLTPAKLISFGLIWCGLLIYSTNLWPGRRP